MLNGYTDGGLPPAPHPIFKPLGPPSLTPPPPPGGKSAYNPYTTDPGYQAALQNEQAQGGAITSGLNSQIAARLIALGDSSLAGKYGVDPAMIKANYDAGNSAFSRLDKSHKQNLQSIVNTLAGRGLLFSGDTGYQSNQENTQYGNQKYDLDQAALADILGYRQSALQQQQGLHQGVVDALMSAYQNYLNHPELGGYGQPPPPAPAGSLATLPPPPKSIFSSAGNLSNLHKILGF